MKTIKKQIFVFCDVWLALMSVILPIKKAWQLPGFFDTRKSEYQQRINAWSTADAYELCADQLSYAQPYGHHE